jgi:cytidylate kinase
VAAHRSPADAVVARLAERNVKIGRVRDRIASALAGRSPSLQPERHLGPFITVARVHGAGGGEVARRIGAMLGWSVLDHELVELVASHLHIDPAMADLLDRSAATWVSDVLSSLWPNAVATRDSYTQELRRALQLLAMHGDVVLLGHAAQLFLPRERGLSIRVVGADHDRIARIRARRGVDEAEARQQIARVDRSRAQFVSRTFGREVSDPLLYDVVFNSSCLQLDQIAELAVAAWRGKWLTAAEPVRRAS